MKMRSLRVRLIVGGVAAIVAALALAGLALNLLFERHVIRTVGEELDVHVRQLLGGLELDRDGRVVVTRAPVDPRFSDPLSGLYWQVGNGKEHAVRSRSLWDGSLDLPADEIRPGEEHRHEMKGPAGERVLVVERGVQLTRGGQALPVRVSVAADLGVVARASAAFSRDLALALGLLALVLGLATSVQVGLGLQPLDSLRHAVSEIRSGRSRKFASGVPAEVMPLVDELNALLEAQDKEMERSRDRAADLAHGLKTPLAALASDAERLRRRGEVEIAQDIEQVGEVMSRHVDRELARSRVRGRARRKTWPHTELGPLVGALIATIGRAQGGRGPVLEARIPDGLAVPIERTDLAEVLGNLLENAARYARSRVVVAATAQAEGVRVEIEDDGVGLAREMREATLERGRRLDESGRGAGLGLAIVQDVLEAYGWRLTLDEAQLGGLKAVIAPDAGQREQAPS